MFDIITNEEEAREYIDGHDDAPFFDASGNAYMCGSGHDCVRHADAARKLLAAEYIGDDDVFSTSDALGSTAGELVDGGEMVRVLLDCVAVTDDAREALDAQEGRALVPVDDYRQARALLERAEAGAFGRLVSEARDNLGYETDEHGEHYLRVYYDQEDRDANVGAGTLRSWLEGDSLVDQERLYTYEGFVGHVADRICDSSWFDEEDMRRRFAFCNEVSGLFDMKVAELEGSGKLPDYLVFAELADSRELDEDLLEEGYLHDGARDLVEGRSDLCVDVFLTEGEEWNYDYVQYDILRTSLAGYSDSDCEDELANNGMSWLAERLGLPRDCMLNAADEDAPGHDMWYELLNFTSSNMGVLTLTCRLSVEDWVEMVCASKRGDEVTIEGKDLVAGLYDPWCGGGSVLGLSVTGPLTIPSENIAGIGVELGKTIVSEGISTCYSIQDVYGVGEDLWRPAKVACGEHVSEVAAETVPRAPSRGA